MDDLVSACEAFYGLHILLAFSSKRRAITSSVMVRPSQLPDYEHLDPAEDARGVIKYLAKERETSTLQSRYSH